MSGERKREEGGGGGKRVEFRVLNRDVVGAGARYVNLKNEFENAPGKLACARSDSEGI